MDRNERREAPALARLVALMCVRQSRLADLHRGRSPVIRTGGYSDVLVVDADGRRIPPGRKYHVLTRTRCGIGCADPSPGRRNDAGPQGVG